MLAMDVSIIIPTFNNAAMLATTLSAFEHVDFPRETELIVVDNNSTDNTRKTVESFSDRLPAKYAFEPNQGISAAKNLGLRIAVGELLIFTDDDVRPDPIWIRTYLSAYNRDTKGIFWGGPVVSQFEGSVPSQRLLRFAPPSVCGLTYGGIQRALTANEWFISANWACTREALSLVGLFDETIGLHPNAPIVLVGEETELQRRLKAAGYTGMYLPEASLHHVVPARKCTLEHIANRIEAGGRLSRAITPVERGTKTLRGVPLWR
jgi:glucosyl-dolichyl phosphate glucuronosyltransferase